MNVSELNTAISSVAAALSAFAAYQSYKLSKKVVADAKSDERLIFSKPEHPDLQCKAHRDCVLRIAVFNKSNRKSFIDNVAVFSESGEKIDVEMAGEIDSLGNPQNPSNILGVVDQANLFLRRNDGLEFGYTKIILFTSFSTERLSIVHDPIKSFTKS